MHPDYKTEVQTTTLSWHIFDYFLRISEKKFNQYDRIEYENACYAMCCTTQISHL